MIDSYTCRMSSGSSLRTRPLYIGQYNTDENCPLCRGRLYPGLGLIAVVDNGRFLSGLNEALRIISQIEDSQEDDIVIDFCDVRFVSPLFVLPLMVYLNRIDKRVQMSNLSSYLRTVNFGEGLKPDEMRELEYKAQMESFAKNTSPKLRIGVLVL